MQEQDSQDRKYDALGDKTVKEFEYNYREEFIKKLYGENANGSFKVKLVNDQNVESIIIKIEDEKFLEDVKRAIKEAPLEVNVDQINALQSTLEVPAENVDTFIKAYRKVAKERTEDLLEYNELDGTLGQFKKNYNEAFIKRLYGNSVQGSFKIELTENRKAIQSLKIEIGNEVFLQHLKNTIRNSNLGVAINEENIPPTLVIPAQDVKKFIKEYRQVIEPLMEEKRKAVVEKATQKMVNDLFAVRDAFDDLMLIYSKQKTGKLGQTDDEVDKAKQEVVPTHSKFVARVKNIGSFVAFHNFDERALTYATCALENATKDQIMKGLTTLLFLMRNHSTFLATATKEEKEGYYKTYNMLYDVAVSKGAAYKEIMSEVSKLDIKAELEIEELVFENRMKELERQLAEVKKEKVKPIIQKINDNSQEIVTLKNQKRKIEEGYRYLVVSDLSAVSSLKKALDEQEKEQVDEDAKVEDVIISIEKQSSIFLTGDELADQKTSLIQEVNDFQSNEAKKPVYVLHYYVSEEGGRVLKGIESIKFKKVEQQGKYVEQESGRWVEDVDVDNHPKRRWERDGAYETNYVAKESPGKFFGDRLPSLTEEVDKKIKEKLTLSINLEAEKRNIENLTSPNSNPNDPIDKAIKQLHTQIIHLRDEAQESWFKDPDVLKEKVKALEILEKSFRGVANIRKVGGYDEGIAGQEVKDIMHKWKTIHQEVINKSSISWWFKPEKTATMEKVEGIEAIIAPKPAR